MMLIMAAGVLVVLFFLLIGLNARKIIKTGTMISIMCAICLSCITGYLITSVMTDNTGKTISIKATYTKNENSQGEDIGIKSFYIGDKALNFSNSEYEDKWLYQNNTLSWGYSKEQSIDVIVPIYTGSKIEFVKNQWAGIVEISDGESTQQIDLYSPDETTYIVSIEKGNSNEINQFYIKTVGLIALSAVIIFAVCIIIGNYFNKKRIGEKVSKAKEYISNNPYLFARMFIILISFVVMLKFAGDFSLWSDDLATIEFVSEQNTLSQNIDSILEDATHNPPLYYILAFFWLRIMPYGTVFIKLLNIILVCAGGFLLGTLAKKIRGDRAAFIVTILSISSYFVVSQAAYTFRSYGLVYPLVVLLLMAYYNRISKPDEKKAYLLYGIVAALLLYTHYTSIIVLGLMGVCDCFLFARKKIKFNFIISYIGAGIAFMPLLLYKIGAMVSEHASYWPEVPDFNSLYTTYTGLLNGSTLLIGMFGAGICLNLILIANKKFREELKYSFADVVTIVNAAVISVGTVAFVYVYSAFINPNGSIYVIRYFTIIAPAVLLVTGVTISEILENLAQKSRKYICRGTFIILSAALFTSNMEYCVRSLGNFPGTINSPYEQAIDWIYRRADAHDDSTLVMMTGYTGGLYYYGTHHFQRENLNFGTLTDDNWKSYEVIYVSPMHGEIPYELNQILQEHYEEMTKNVTLNVTGYRKK